MALINHLGLPLLVLSAAASLPASDDINWLGNYSEARKVARETGKPLLVEFRCEA